MNRTEFSQPNCIINGAFAFVFCTAIHHKKLKITMQRGLGRKKYLSVQAVKVSAAHIWSQAKKVASLSHFFFLLFSCKGFRTRS